MFLDHIEDDSTEDSYATTPRQVDLDVDPRMERANEFQAATDNGWNALLTKYWEEEVREDSGLKKIDRKVWSFVFGFGLLPIAVSLGRELISAVIYGRVTATSLNTNIVTRRLQFHYIDSDDRPGIYHLELVTKSGDPPSPKEMSQVVDDVERYIKDLKDLTPDDITHIREIDAVIGIAKNWPPSVTQAKVELLGMLQLARRTVSHGSGTIIVFEISRQWTEAITVRLDTYWDTSSWDSPMDAALVQIGYAKEPKMLQYLFTCMDKMVDEL